MLDGVREMQPKGVELDAQSQRILDVLRSATDWMNRRDIARAMNKKQLNPYDIAVLQVLTGQGLIEASQRDNNSPVGWEWMYRAKS